MNQSSVYTSQHTAQTVAAENWTLVAPADNGGVKLGNRERSKNYQLPGK